MTAMLICDETDPAKAEHIGVARVALLDALMVVDGLLEGRQGKESGLEHQSLTGPQAQPTPTNGEPSSPPDPTLRPRLNVSFTEWLMGLPVGWTDVEHPIEPIAFAQWVTASLHNARPER